MDGQTQKLVAAYENAEDALAERLSQLPQAGEDCMCANPHGYAMLRYRNVDDRIYVVKVTTCLNCGGHIKEE